MICRETVLAALSRHIGAARGIRARELVAEIEGMFACPAHERELRHVIEALRREGHPILSATAWARRRVSASLGSMPTRPQSRLY